MAYTPPLKITGPMPEHMHDDDRQWVFAQLCRCSDMPERRKVCEAYSRVYSAAHDAEPNEVRKDGMARRAANTRLREYIAKKFRVFSR